MSFLSFVCASDCLLPPFRDFTFSQLLFRICGFQGAFHAFLLMMFLINSGGHLLSRTVSSAVPSAGRVLTVVFGMGTGVSPGRIAARFFRYLRAFRRH